MQNLLLGWCFLVLLVSCENLHRTPKVNKKIGRKIGMVSEKREMELRSLPLESSIPGKKIQMATVDRHGHLYFLQGTGLFAIANKRVEQIPLENYAIFREQQVVQVMPLKQNKFLILAIAKKKKAQDSSLDLSAEEQSQAMTAHVLSWEIKKKQASASTLETKLWQSFPMKTPLFSFDNDYRENFPHLLSLSTDNGGAAVFYFGPQGTVFAKFSSDGVLEYEKSVESFEDERSFQQSYYSNIYSVPPIAEISPGTFMTVLRKERPYRLQIFSGPGGLEQKTLEAPEFENVNFCANGRDLFLLAEKKNASAASENGPKSYELLVYSKTEEDGDWGLKETLPLSEESKKIQERSLVKSIACDERFVYVGGTEGIGQANTGSVVRPGKAFILAYARQEHRWKKLVFNHPRSGQIEHILITPHHPILISAENIPLTHDENRNFNIRINQLLIAPSFGSVKILKKNSILISNLSPTPIEKSFDREQRELPYLSVQAYRTVSSNSLSEYKKFLVQLISLGSMNQMNLILPWRAFWEKTPGIEVQWVDHAANEMHINTQDLKKEWENLPRDLQDAILERTFEQMGAVTAYQFLPQTMSEWEQYLAAPLLAFNRANWNEHLIRNSSLQSFSILPHLLAPAVANNWGEVISSSSAFGPNCWYFAIATNFSNWSELRFMGEEEFSCHLKTSFRKLEKNEKIRPGDVMRIFDHRKKIDWHAAVYLGQSSTVPHRYLFLSKNGHQSGEVLAMDFETLTNQLYPTTDLQDIQYYRPVKQAEDPAVEGEALNCREEYLQGLRKYQ